VKTNSPLHNCCSYAVNLSIMKQFIVVIGYSAGGLEALTKFFDATPCDGVSYIVLNHVPSDTVSYLKTILNRHSKLEVIELFDVIPVANNKVYLVPPGNYLVMKDRALQIVPRSGYDNTVNCSIDIFLESVAKETSYSTIAIFLSGFGNDGAKGASLIKEAGGMILVQEPDSCFASNIPNEVMKATTVDGIYLPEDMPVAIQKIVAMGADASQDKRHTSLQG